jgi:hypothetical protein
MTPVVVPLERVQIFAHFQAHREPVFVEACAINHFPERIVHLTTEMGSLWTVVAIIPMARRDKLGFQKQKSHEHRQ